MAYDAPTKTNGKPTPGVERLGAIKTANDDLIELISLVTVLDKTNIITYITHSQRRLGALQRRQCMSDYGNVGTTLN